MSSNRGAAPQLVKFIKLNHPRNIQLLNINGIIIIIVWLNSLALGIIEAYQIQRNGRSDIFFLFDMTHNGDMIFIYLHALSGMTKFIINLSVLLLIVALAHSRNSGETSFLSLFFSDFIPSVSVCYYSDKGRREWKK